MSLSSRNSAELSVSLPTTLQTDNPLWHFALTFWQQPDVQESCLTLQHQGWSVTKLLTAGWLALSNRRYNGVEGVTLTEWRDRVTESLRAVRQWLPKVGSDYQNLRGSLAALELDAERIELALVWQALTHNHQEKSTMQGRETLIRYNLEAAAPFSDAVGRAASQLDTLADVLANFPKGAFRP